MLIKVQLLVSKPDKIVQFLSFRFTIETFFLDIFIGKN